MRYNFIANQLAQEGTEEFMAKVNDEHESLGQDDGTGDSSINPGQAKQIDPSK